MGLGALRLRPFDAQFVGAFQAQPRHRAFEPEPQPAEPAPHPAVEIEKTQMQPGMGGDGHVGRL
jgi:hypothetical protein